MTSNDKQYVLSLSGGYSLVRAEYELFSAQFAVYRENIRFRRDWSLPLTSVPPEQPCYWVYRSDRRVGGTVLAPGRLGPLYLEPPFVDLPELLDVLLRQVRAWTGPAADIDASGVLPDQFDSFARAGFRLMESRRGMMRPTEPFETASWPAEVEAGAPQPDDAPGLARLYRGAYTGSVDSAAIAHGSEEELLAEVKEYFDLYPDPDSICRKASLVLRERGGGGGGDPVAVCMIAAVEGWPFIENVAVRPDRQGQGLASGLIRHALSALYGHSPLLLLFVTQGNAAEGLYFRLGFQSGPPVARMSLPALNHCSTDS